MKSLVPRKTILWAVVMTLLLAGAPSALALGPGGSTPTLLAQQAGARSRARAAKQEGDSLLRAGKHGQAEQAYRKAAKLDPTWYEPLEAIGNLLFRQGKYAKAAEAFKRAVALEPKYHTGLYNIAYAYRKAGRYQEAVEYYRKYLAAKPDDPDGYYGLAATYEAMGEWKLARQNYLLYAEREQRPSERRYVIKAREKAQMLAKKLGMAPPAPATTPPAAAPAKTAALVKTAAKSAGTTAPPAAPEPATVERPATRPGQTTAAPPARTGSTTPAVTTAPSAPAAAASRPNPPPAPDTAEKVKQLLRSGDQAMAEKSYSKALADYYAAVRLDGDNPEALFKLGNVYAATGNQKAAELKWRKVLTINPHHQGARAALAKVQSRATTGAKPAAASREKETEKGPVAKAAASAIVAATRPSLTSQAGPGSKPATTVKTPAARPLAKPEKAAEGRAASPAQAQAGTGEVRRLLAAGDDFFKQKSFARAIDSYTKAARLDPKNEEALFKLGMAYALAGNYQVAIYKWQQVLKINPGNKSAQRNIERARRLMAQKGKQPAPGTQVKPNLGQVRALLAAGQARRALKMVDEWLKTRSRDPEGLLLKGRALLLLKDYSKAKRVFSRAMVADPARAEPFFGLGEACRLSGDRDRARYYYRMYLRSRAADLDPDKVKQAQSYLGG